MQERVSMSLPTEIAMQRWPAAISRTNELGGVPRDGVNLPPKAAPKIEFNARFLLAKRRLVVYHLNAIEYTNHQA